jgi:hypothetical protein
MKLPIPQLSTEEYLKEFDIWITPSLGDISDTEKFRKELNRIVSIFEILGDVTNYFQDENNCTVSDLMASFTVILQEKNREERIQFLKSLASTLYCVTGKSDNNLKCQFPIFLRDVVRCETMPTQTIQNADRDKKPIPRELKSDTILEMIASLDNHSSTTRFLEYFVTFLLGTENASRQFWSLGHSYYHLKSFGKGYELNLLAPIVIFKIRGSVTASGGHEPETIMRTLLEEWGLAAEEDFNTTDVIVAKNKSISDKTRAYDFVLPFKTQRWFSSWNHRLMIQCQFYAGDSGSVSHKNVDQTKTSRDSVLQKYKNVRFVEFVDGAGYFSSLNGDLKKLLAMKTTASFTQIRSIPIRVRRELQYLGFLMPLEIEHAIAQTNGIKQNVINNLLSQKYKRTEIEQSISIAQKRELITVKGRKFCIIDQRRDLVRQYYILDTIAQYSNTVSPSSSVILVPGYGAFYGLEMDKLVETIMKNAGQFDKEIGQSKILLADLKTLANRGFCMIGR